MQVRKLTSRRDFLRVAALGAAGTAVLAACGPAAQPTAAPAPTTKPAAAATAAPAATPTVAAQAAASGTKTEISFSWWLGGEAANKVFETAVDRFEAASTKYKVKRMPSAGSEYQQKLVTQFAAGTAPDAPANGYGWLAQFAVKGVILELDPLVQRDAKDVMPEDQWEAPWGMTKWAGKQYSLPRETFGLFLYVYNEDLFKAAGEQTPAQLYDAGKWTWDTWRDVSIKMTKRDSSGKATQYGSSISMNSYWAEVMSRQWGQKEGIQTADYKKALFNTPAMVEMIQFLADVRLKDKAAPRPEETKDFNWMGNGQMAVTSAATWSVPNFRRDYTKFKWDVVPPPAGKSGSVNITGNDHHCINKASKQQDGAWELLKFLNSPTEDLFWATNMWGLPFHKSNLEKFQAEIAKAPPPFNGKYLSDMAKVALSIPPDNPFTNETSDIIGSNIGQALDGSKPVKDVLDTINKKMDEAFAKGY